MKRTIGVAGKCSRVRLMPKACHCKPYMPDGYSKQTQQPCHQGSTALTWSNSAVAPVHWNFLALAHHAPTLSNAYGKPLCGAQHQSSSRLGPSTHEFGLDCCATLRLLAAGPLHLYLTPRQAHDTVSSYPRTAVPAAWASRSVPKYFPLRGGACCSPRLDLQHRLAEMHANTSTMEPTFPAQIVEQHSTAGPARLMSVWSVLLERMYAPLHRCPVGCGAFHASCLFEIIYTAFRFRDCVLLWTIHDPLHMSILLLS